MARLVLEGVGKSYGSTRVLANVDLDVASGEFVALLGPSGCGKTTTLRVVAGFVTPDEGGVTLAGRSLVGVPPHKRGIGVVFQSYALFPHLTAARNVAFGLRMRGLPKPEIETKTKAALAMVGLGALGERYPGQLSGGQQQRVALARALVIEPDVLLLDEPLSNLDAGLRHEMRDEIGRLRRQLGITMLFVTHDQSEALATADRVVVMDKGRIVEIAAPEDLSERPNRAFTARFLGGRTVLAGGIADGVFRAGGVPIRLPADLASTPTHAVLRANKLVLGTSAPADALVDIEVKVTSRAFLGDQYQLRVETDGFAADVLAPIDPSPPPVGAVARLAGRADAVRFLSDPGA